MKTAIAYASKTGNTKLLAETIRAALPQQEVIFCDAGTPPSDAELYFIGSWTDKGNCDAAVSDLLHSLQNKKIAYFGTAGFGGSPAYYEQLWQRVVTVIPEGNQLLGHFYCQGKMPMSVRERYVALMTAHPDDTKLQVNVENFDRALSHPDDEDLHAVRSWAKEMYAFAEK